MAVGPEVMLASYRKNSDPTQVLAELVNAGDWWFELKFDGVRAVLNRTADGRVTITNRLQVDITVRYPDVVAEWAEVPFTGVLDGEIVVMVDGRPQFEGAHLRDAQSSPAKINAVMRKHPATFIPFDVLTQDARDLRSLPYTRRRMILANLGVPGAAPASQDGLAMWQFVLGNDLEGLMAKRGVSAYRPGRQGAWRKIKHTKRISALVGGIVPGKGSRGPVGALELYLIDPASSSLVPIGSVGSGMTTRDMGALARRIADQVPTVVEVEYLSLNPTTGQLRMPVFKGMRSDADPMDCTVGQLLRS